MRDFLRFPIDAADQARVIPSTIQVADMPGGTNVLPVAHTLRIKFGVNNPLNGPPRLRPMFPGYMLFIPDATDTRIQPTAAQVDFSQYSTWRTNGTLVIFYAPSELPTDLKNVAGTNLLVAPNMAWYSKITLSKDFLQTTLAAHKADISGVVTKGSGDWIKHAVSLFLAGSPKFLPQLKLSSGAASDDVAKLPMPFVEMDAQGRVTLDVSTARGHAPRDAPDTEFNAIAGGLASHDPRHPRNGSIPARLVLQKLRNKMIDAAIGDPVPDAILQPPNDLAYVTIRFTRIWKPQEDVSAYFPAMSVEVGKLNPAAQLSKGPIPAHGIFHVPVPANSVPAKITVKITGPMTWVDGGVTNCWREIGGKQQFTFNLPSVPHIQLRRRMTDEMKIEPADSSGGNACTYFSLRRTVRALINNRISGGRLNYGRNTTNATTIKLINDAFTSGGSNAKAAAVANNKPKLNVTEDKKIRAQAETLIPILEAFFPGTAPTQVGFPTPTTRITNGLLFYDLWQSRASQFELDGKKGNYPDAHIGRGAPGALVAFNLANYQENGDRISGESDNVYWDRLVRGMLSLSPGDLHQLWDQESDFVSLKNRQWLTTSGHSYGHSPVFKEKSIVNGRQVITVYDQFGPTVCGTRSDAGKLRLGWGKPAPTPDETEEVWISAKWLE